MKNWTMKELLEYRKGLVKNLDLLYDKSKDIDSDEIKKIRTMIRRSLIKELFKVLEEIDRRNEE